MSKELTHAGKAEKEQATVKPNLLTVNRKK